MLSLCLMQAGSSVLTSAVSEAGRARHRRLQGRAVPGRRVTFTSASAPAKKEEKHAPSPQAAGGEKKPQRTTKPLQDNICQGCALPLAGGDTSR